MNRYVHSDLYPQFHVNFIKKGSVNDVAPVALADMGFTEDVDYRDQLLEELPKDRKEVIVAEFMFLIDRLLPRNIQDLFYRIALDPRPAYWKAFEQAVNIKQLERYADHNKSNYGQFVDHVQKGIMDMIEEGMSLLDIYDSTCVTKQMLIETADSLFMGDYASQEPSRCKLIPIEIVVWGIKDATYRIGEDFSEIIVQSGKDVLAILTVDYERYIGKNYSSDDDNDYVDKECADEDYRDNIDFAILDYEKDNIPVILVDPLSCDEPEEAKKLRNAIRNSIGNIDYARRYNEERKHYLAELYADDEDDISDATMIRECPFRLFEGQIKDMKLISNHICFGPCPEPDDEVEQHLSLFADGRVFFSGYVYGEYTDIRYKRNRSKQFKISQLEASYVLNHVAMYFSKDFPLDFATDVGDWKLELTNTEGEKFEYQGSLYRDLLIDEVGLSYLLRKYLGMTDLFAFDGDARLPISKKENEYIFVNVYFEWGGKTYCYLCDDELIQDGDEVLVPVGREGELKTVIVDSVELHTAEDAPFPIGKCKKVVRRV